MGTPKLTSNKMSACFVVMPFILLSSLAGCFQPEPITQVQLERGKIVMLPGVESGAWQFEKTHKGLRAAGIDRAIEVIEWGLRPFGSLPNLVDLPANQQRARCVADRIAKYHENYPDKPITLIGYSGGGGLAVLTAEALADEVMLDRLILLAPALSPEYDLSKALSKCRNGCVHFYSNNDWWTLGVGTSLFGTIDRKQTDSAGYVGFKNAKGDILNHGRLTQIAWKPEWIVLGHRGGHTGWLAKDWAQKTLAPQIDPSLQ